MKRYTIKPLVWEYQVHEDREYYEAGTPFGDFILEEEEDYTVAYLNGDQIDEFDSLEEAMENINEYWKDTIEEALVVVTEDNGDGYY